MSEKRFYWLKLSKDFFSSKRIKKLRRLAGGDTYTIIYLKMQLLAMQTEGVLTWSGLEDDFASELALDLDESPENVSVTLQYLLSCGLAETNDSASFFFPWAVANTGSETTTAQRMRDSRARKSSLCNNVTPALQERYTEKEKEEDKEKEKRFRAPSVEEVAAYCAERQNNVDAETFVDFYASKGWMVGSNHMKDWKAAVRTWEKDTKRRRSSAVKEKEPRLDDLERAMQRL